MIEGQCSPPHFGLARSRGLLGREEQLRKKTLSLEPTQHGTTALLPHPHLRTNAVTTNLHASDADRGDVVCREGVQPRASDVLDLEGLCKRCMGNIDLVQRVLKTFQQRIPGEMEAMEKALEARDTEQIARVAHRVKGSSASVSAAGVARAAAEIEDVSRAGSVTDIPASIGHLHDEWGQYLDYATRLLPSADVM